MKSGVRLLFSFHAFLADKFYLWGVFTGSNVVVLFRKCSRAICVVFARCPTGGPWQVPMYIYREKDDISRSKGHSLTPMAGILPTQKACKGESNGHIYGCYSKILIQRPGVVEGVLE